MKKNFLKLILLSLILTIVFSSCEKEKVCGVDNPQKDLPWLKEFIDVVGSNAQAGFSHHVKIYQCTYRNGIGFLIEPCVGCPDAGFLLVNCEGKCLCNLWGFTGDSCTEYNIDFKRKKLIWKN